MRVQAAAASERTAGHRLDDRLAAVPGSVAATRTTTPTPAPERGIHRGRSQPGVLGGAYPLDLDGIEDQRILWERTVRNLILQVVDRTGCGSGWYGHCQQVLTWFLDRWGRAGRCARACGRGDRWAVPQLERPRTVLVDDVAERVTQELSPDNRPRLAAQPAVDHLEHWLAVRETVAWHEAQDRGGYEPVTPRRDGAADDIRAFDGALDPARAEGLLAALGRLRADAARGAPLDFALLQRWQQHVLGTPRLPAFRCLPAFAKAGRERYGITPDTHARLDACLAQSAKDNGTPLRLAARAARAYLDVWC